MTYSYYPENINTDMKDRMRFELADNDVSQNELSAALADEEITAMLEQYPKNFKMAKFKLVEHLLFRYGQDVDNKVGPVSWTFSNRTEMWKKIYDDMKKDMALSCSGIKPYGGKGKKRKNYFYVGMMNNPGGDRNS